MAWLDAAGAAMWELVQHYTGKVSYKLGAKSDALICNPPVIDCSGWVALLLTAAMSAASQNEAAFSTAEFAAVQTNSERIIENLERRSGLVIAGDTIRLGTLPSYSTIGLQQGGGTWSANLSRLRGITHIVQVVRRPEDGSPYVSEAAGFFRPPGIRLLPLVDWLERTDNLLKTGTAWAVGPFRRSLISRSTSE